jgi:two-component sensor histidine kinase
MNAIQHAFPSGFEAKILLKLITLQDEVTLSITDNGAGFGGARNSRGKGQSIVSELARLLGGALSDIRL